jgi:hypothetical protein
MSIKASLEEGAMRKELRREACSWRGKALTKMAAREKKKKAETNNDRAKHCSFGPSFLKAQYIRHCLSGKNLSPVNRSHGQIFIQIQNRSPNVHP